jgi:hypothetical protein
MFPGKPYSNMDSVIHDEDGKFVKAETGLRGNGFSAFASYGGRVRGFAVSD